MNGLHLTQVNEYDQIVIFRKKPKKPLHASCFKVFSYFWGDLRMRAKVDKSENKKNNGLSDQKLLIRN